MSELQEIEILGRKFRVSVAEQHQWFWQQIRDGIFEPETFGLYKRRITENTLYIDIGSWIGPMVLYGGSLAKRVVAVEPIAVSMAAMLQNLELNDDVLQKTQLFNLAIAPETSIIKLYNNAFGDGMASILPSRGSLSMTLMAMSIDDFLDRALGDEEDIFIKVDVEGAEFDLVPKLCESLKRRHLKANLYVSVHGSFAQDATTNIGAWADNLARHGTLVKALADYGDVLFSYGDTFAPIDGPFSSYEPLNRLLIDGGFDATLFVKAF